MELKIGYRGVSMNFIVYICLLLSINSGALNALQAAQESTQFDKNLLNNELCTAALEGNAKLSAALIKKGAQIDYRDKNGNTPLYYALESEHLGTVRLFIPEGMIVPARLVERLEKILSLLPIYNEDLVQAAHRGNLDDLKKIINVGADVNYFNLFGNTPLHVAIEGGQIDCIRILLAEGADSNAHKNDRGRNPAYEVRQDILIYKGTPLQAACEDSRLDIVEILVASGTDVNKYYAGEMPPLAMAAWRGDMAIVNLLLGYSAHVNAAGPFGTALCAATRNVVKIDECLKIVSLLEQSGADCNLSDVDRNTPLHNAAMNNLYPMVKFLIKMGAHVNAQNQDLETPLHCAIAKGHEKVSRILLKACGDVELRDKNAWTPPQRGSINNDRVLCRSGYLFILARKSSYERILATLNVLRGLPPYVRINVLLQDPTLKLDALHFLLYELRNGNPYRWLIFHVLKEQLIDLLNDRAFNIYVKFEGSIKKNRENALRAGLEARVEKLRKKAQRLKRKDETSGSVSSSSIETSELEKNHSDTK